MSEHRHIYGRIERSRMAYSVHRKCLLDDCDVICIDLGELVTLGRDVTETDLDGFVRPNPRIIGPAGTAVTLTEEGWDALEDGDEPWIEVCDFANDEELMALIPRDAIGDARYIGGITTNNEAEEDE